MKKILIFAILTTFLFACTGGETTNTNNTTNTGTDTLKETKSENIVKLEGPKKRIAIIKFEDKSGSAWYKAGDVGEGMSDMLTTSMFKSGNFNMVERQEMQSIMDEQKLGQTGLVTANSAAKVGKLLGANVIVIGTVTEFGPKEREISAGGAATGELTKGLISGIGLKTVTVRVAVDMKMIDTTTGEILLAETASAEEKSRNINFSSWEVPSFRMGGAEFDNTLIGKATREAINKMVNKISGTMQNVAWKGYVLKVEGDSVIINAGADAGIEKGMLFSVQGPGEEIEDAEGRIFYVPGDDVAEIEVTAVLDKISKAKVTSGEGIEKDAQIVLK